MTWAWHDFSHSFFTIFSCAGSQVGLRAIGRISSSQGGPWWSRTGPTSSPTHPPVSGSQLATLTDFFSLPELSGKISENKNWSCTTVHLQQFFWTVIPWSIVSTPNICHCSGGELYNCVWFKTRGPNIMEFQLGLHPSQAPSFHHCDNDHFLQRTWLTQARINPRESVSCPIAGQYAGVLPDAPGLCAHLSSDCDNKDKMFYTVTECHNTTTVYQGKV